MANCTNCGEFQPRLKNGSKCNECFNHGNRNIVKRKDANDQNPTVKQSIVDDEISNDEFV